MPAGHSRQTSVAQPVGAALRLVAGEQLCTGEIANYRRTETGAWEYCFGVLASAVAHDALGVLDPLSATFAPQALERVTDDRRGAARLAADIRRRIRRFLAWQQRTDGTWRFFGHGSALPSDLETTACAAAALLDDGGARPIDSVISRRALHRFPRRAGLVQSPGSRDDWRPDPWAERAANVHLLRCLILNGSDRLNLDAALAADWPFEGTDNGSTLWLLYAVGRLAERSHVPALEDLARRASAALGTRDSDGGAFIGPLTSALWLSIVIDFGHRHAIGAAADRVRHWLCAPSRARIESVSDHRCAGPGLTTAVAIGSLARAALAEELDSR